MSSFKPKIGIQVKLSQLGHKKGAIIPYFGSTQSIGQQDQKYLQQLELEPKCEGLAHDFEVLMTVADHNIKQLCS
jgi:hypothetical protein